MKSILIHLLLALLLSLSSVALRASPPGLPLASNELYSVRVAASNSLATFQRHITRSNYGLMGFNTASEILTATNGEPLLSYIVPFRQLTNYQAGDLKPLLEPPDRNQLNFRVFVPIMVGTDVRSSLRLRPEQAPGDTTGATSWARVDWGHPTVIRNLTWTLEVIPNVERKTGTVPFAVELPVPRIWLIGYFDQQNKLVLRTTTDLHIATNTIIRGEVVSEPAMQQLSTEARRHNPSLPN